MSQSQYDIVANGNGNVALNNDLLLVDAAINLANGHNLHHCDNRVTTVADSLAAAAATLMAGSPPSSSHSDQHPGFPQNTANDINHKVSYALSDSNNNSLGSNGSLNGGSTIGNNKPLYGHLMNGGGNGVIGGGINISMSEGMTGSSSGSPSPLMMKPPMNMQFYQQQWQQQQYHENRQPYHQMQYLHGLQQQHRLQQQSVSKGANTPNAIAALTGECCPMTNSVLLNICTYFYCISIICHHHRHHHHGPSLNQPITNHSSLFIIHRILDQTVDQIDVLFAHRYILYLLLHREYVTEIAPYNE